MTPGAEIEPGPHWWKASALTTRPTLPPQLLESIVFFPKEIRHGCTIAGTEYIMHQSFKTPAPLHSSLSGDFHLIYTSIWFPGRRGIRLKSRSSHPLRVICWPLKDQYTLLDGLAYNTRGYFAKPSNKRFIIPLQKGVILLQFYLERVF